MLHRAVRCILRRPMGRARRYGRRPQSVSAPPGCAPCCARDRVTPRRRCLCWLFFPGVQKARLAWRSPPRDCSDLAATAIEVLISHPPRRPSPALRPRPGSTPAPSRTAAALWPDQAPVRRAVLAGALTPAASARAAGRLPLLRRRTARAFDRHPCLPPDCPPHGTVAQVAGGTPEAALQAAPLAHRRAAAALGWLLSRSLWTAGRAGQSLAGSLAARERTGLPRRRAGRALAPARASARTALGRRPVASPEPETR